ncbi:unnamed protein product [Schistosoma margrebowiei]|uniref:Uncharacterized protein n=1 Tax=Schistosoma margrebowiei TaxID=48269 RepID=A0A183LMB7_9TREM|nr:unnamed protein product [Schistosoma margrebowiei]
MQEKTTSVAATSAAGGLNIHKGKSKILRYNTACTDPVTIDGEDLEDINIFKYLISINDQNDGSDADVKARIGTKNNCQPKPRSELSTQMSKKFYYMGW